jgi:hypothetical protein
MNSKFMTNSKLRQMRKRVINHMNSGYGRTTAMTRVIRRFRLNKREAQEIWENVVKTFKRSGRVTKKQAREMLVL